MRFISTRIRWVGLAATGILLFIATNWWPLATGDPEQEAAYETVPKITKTEAVRYAQTWLKAEKGGEPDITGASVVYQSDMILSGYLHKNKLFDDYRKRYEARYPLDYYQVELKDGDGADYLIDLNMEDGSVIGWLKHSTRAAPGAAEGRKIAESYLKKKGYSLTDFTFVEPSGDRPSRFRFEHKSERAGEASLQLAVDVKGGEVTGFHPVFSVPEQHLAWLDKQDDASSAMTRWNLIISALMALAAVVYAVKYRKQAAFSRGILLTMAFIAAYVINNINMYPAFKSIGMAQGDPFQSSAGAVVMVVIMNAVVLAMGSATYLSLVAGQQLWSMRGIQMWPRWNESAFGRETLDAMGRGYMIAAFMLGVQSLLFWIAEKKFDVWAVNDPANSLYNMLQPGWFPLMAWAAAISEEAVYRFFGIILFKKLLRSTFLAVLVPSMIWAFSHTQYPIYPVYTRFVEVTVLGMIFGYTFLKHGFLTALFAHAVMDSFLMSLSLMNLGGAGYTAGGLLYMASPALIAAAVWLLHGAFRGRRPHPPAAQP